MFAASQRKKKHKAEATDVLLYCVIGVAVAVCIFQHVDPYLKHKLRQIKDMVEN